MSADDRFRGIDWKDVLHRLTLHSRHLFASARAKGYGNALARACVDPDDLARTVLAAVLQNETVKYKPGKGASLTTFLSRVLEDDFKDLLRKGMRLNRRLATLDVTAVRDAELPSEPGVVYELGDDGQSGKVIHLRAAALHAANGNKELEEYLTAAFDCGASKRADQAELLGVPPSIITNRRKRFLKLLNSGANDASGDSEGEE